MTLLEAKGIEAAYGHSQALFGVDLSLNEGQCLALLGRNGMGKTTTVRCLCGLLGLKNGSIHIKGQDSAKLKAYEIAQLGIGLVPEGRRCFQSLNVLENLIATARPGPFDQAAVTKLFPRLGERLDQRASLLSGGEQQMLAIGRALMTNPTLLILDEATEGLAPVIRQEIWQVIGELRRKSGLAILVIDKSIPELRTIADQAVFLDKGRSVWSGAMQTVTPDLLLRYLGV